VLVLYALGGDALNASTALLANAAGVTVALAVGAALARRAKPSALRVAHGTFATAAWLRAALPMMLINGIWMANGYVAILLVGAFAGAREAGIYNVVQKGGELIVLVLFAANMPLAPALARLRARGDRRGLEQTTERVARATVLVSAPVAVAFMAGPTLYLGLFGAGFRTGATALAIVAVGQLANALAGPSGTVLLMTGHERAAARGVAVGLLANLVLALLLIPPLGVTGGAIAFSCSLVLWNVLLVRTARRRLGVNVTALRWLAMSGAERPPGDWLEIAALSLPVPAHGGEAAGE
jgi:O-antigen/teichoic acid export membrane protein